MSSTLTKQSTNSLDLSTMYCLTSLRNLDFLKYNMSSVKWQETKICQEISEEPWQNSEEEAQHGRARIHVSCSIKESV